jgi:hypothetical protein
MRSFDEIEARIDALAGPGDSATAAGELMGLGEEILEHWLTGRNETPTDTKRDGFRLLALHRQGCKGEPSFNACRETCRELAYHHNLIAMDPEHHENAQRIQMASLVAKHLCYFVSGKMQEAKLGEFCCSSRNLRANGA